MPNFSHQQLKEISSAILRAAGARQKDAELVATMLIEANLCGVDSHGVVRIPEYVDRIFGKPGYAAGSPLHPRANITIERQTTNSALINGNWTFGQIIGSKAMKLAIRKAKKAGVASVAIYNCAHLGRMADYSMMAVPHKMIGIVFCKSFPVMAPLGGRTPMLGNNPVSFAVPTGNQEPVVLDIAMSVAARGKILVKKARGEQLPEGWIVDNQGLPSRDPDAFFAGGALTAFGGHKGYGLSVIMELLAGALSGAGCGHDYPGHNSALMTAININSFVPIRKFLILVDKFIADLKKSPKATGSSEITIPGEPEFRQKEKRLKEGIFIEDNTWTAIRKAAEDLGAPIDKFFTNW